MVSIWTSSCGGTVSIAALAGVARTRRCGSRRRLLLSGMSLVLVFGHVTVAAASGLQQLAGANACVSQDGVDGCKRGIGLAGAGRLAVSNDGRNVYVASYNSSAVAALSRDRRTGALTQLAGAAGCTSKAGSGGCASGIGLDTAFDVAISRDGKNVYVASPGSSAVAVFARDGKTGVLTQLPGTNACVNADASDGCAAGIGLEGASSVSISRDGRSVYVTADVHRALLTFARDQTTGALTQLAGAMGCMSPDQIEGCGAARGPSSNNMRAAVSPDGKHVYLASTDPANAVLAFARDRTTGALTQLAGNDGCVSEGGIGGCATGIGLHDAFDVVVTTGGRNVYVASPAGGVAVFERNQRTGALTQPYGTAGCVSDGGAGGCSSGVGLRGPQAVAASHDGSAVYVAALVSDAIATLTRNETTGFLTQAQGKNGCISEAGKDGCTTGVGLGFAQGVATSRDGKNVYTASLLSNAVAAFKVSRRRTSP